MNPSIIENKSKPGYKKTPVGIIPEDWEVKKISDLGDVVTGSTPKTTISEYYNGNELFVSPVDIQGNTYVNQTEKTLTELGIQQGRLVPKNSVLFVCIGSTIGKVSISGKDLITNQQINSIVPNKRTNFYFLFNILKQRAQRIKLLAANQAVPILNKSEFSKIKLPIPPLQEQKSIANCLSTWDLGIEKLTQLIQAKKHQKKGLMQQLLTGKIRLHSETGEKFEGEWREVRLGEISKKKSSTLQANSLIENSGNFPVYGATGFITKINFYDEDEPYIGIVKDGSGVGKIYLLEAKSSVLGTLDKISAKNNSNLYFLFSLLKMLNFEKYKVGGAIPHIYYKDYSNQKILIPSLEEQTAIAEVLQTADKEIELLERKLGAFKEQKKGLMQVLLTGKKRLL